MNNNFFNDDIKKSLLNESVDENDDQDRGQYDIVCEDECNGKKFMIVHDDINDFYAYAIEGSQAFKNKDYPNFEGNFQTKDDAIEEVKKIVGIDDSNGDSGKDGGKETDEISDFILSELGSEYVCNLDDDSGDCKKYRLEGNTEKVDSDSLAKKLEEKFPNLFFGLHRVKYYVKSPEDKHELFFITVCDKKVEEAATAEDKEAAQILNNIADTKEQAGDKKKADALRDAAKVMEEAVGASILDRIAKFVSEKLEIDVDRSAIETDDAGISISIGDKCEKFDLGFVKEIAEFVKQETESENLPDVYVDDTKCPKTIYIDGIKTKEKKIAEARGETGLTEVSRFFYGFIIPEYVVRQFGEDVFLNDGFGKTNNGKIVLYNQMSSDDDFKMFFGDDTNFIHDDCIGQIKTFIEKLNSEAEDKLDVEIETILEDIETGYFVIV